MTSTYELQNGKLVLPQNPIVQEKNQHRSYGPEIECRLFSKVQSA